MPQRKEHEGEDMLVVHKAAQAAPAKSGAPAAGPAAAPAQRVPALDQAEYEVARKRFLALHDAKDRQALLAEVQRKFGNGKAAELVKEMRHKHDDDHDMPRAAKPAKGKA